MCANVTSIIKQTNPDKWPAIDNYIFYPTTLYVRARDGSHEKNGGAISAEIRSVGQKIPLECPSYLCTASHTRYGPPICLVSDHGHRSLKTQPSKWGLGVNNNGVLTVDISGHVFNCSTPYQVMVVMAVARTLNKLVDG